MEDRRSLAPLVVALLFAAALVGGTAVGGLVAYRLFAPVPSIKGPLHRMHPQFLDAEDVVLVDADNSSPALKRK